MGGIHAFFGMKFLDSSRVARTVAQMKMAIFSGQGRSGGSFEAMFEPNAEAGDSDSELVRFYSPQGICSCPCWHIKY